MIEPRLFGYIRDAMAIALVFDGVLNRTPADRAVYHQMERAGATRCRAFGLPFNSPLRAFDVEGLGLRVASARPGANGPPSNLALAVSGFWMRRGLASRGRAGRQEQNGCEDIAKSSRNSAPHAALHYS